MLSKPRLRISQMGMAGLLLLLVPGSGCRDEGRQPQPSREALASAPLVPSGAPRDASGRPPADLPTAEHVLKRLSNKVTLYAQASATPTALEALGQFAFSSSARCSATAIAEVEGRTDSWISLQVLKLLPSSSGSELVAVCLHDAVARASYFVQRPVVLRYEAKADLYVATDGELIGPLATHCPRFRNRSESAELYRDGQFDPEPVDGLCSDDPAKGSRR